MTILLPTITFNGDITINSRDVNFISAPPETDESLLGNRRALILRAGGDITITGDTVTSNDNGWGGPIILAAGGNISTASLDSRTIGTTPGRGGDITLNAGGDITLTNEIQSSSQTSKSGDITLISEQGAINANGVTLDASNSGFGESGTITLQAQNDIRINNLWSRGKTATEDHPGTITVISQAGAIDASGGLIDTDTGSGSANANEGDVTIRAWGDIVTGEIQAGGEFGGGDISLTSTTGGIDTRAGRLSAFSDNGDSGSITLTAENDIITATIESAVGQTVMGNPVNGNSGNITLTSNTGSIDTSGGMLESRTNNGNAGSITLTAENDITTEAIVSFLYEDATGNSGDISVTSTDGSITTLGTLDNRITLGNGGSITLKAENDITTVDAISTTGGTFSLTGRGAIALQAPIDTDGGTITITGNTIDA
ncbi:MAG: hypothetical protein RLP02_36525, partial [Coleofasciculus sp. C2-GNP5-27]